MGGRFSYSPLDQLAKHHGVRIIHPDRPGFGGSDPVALEERIETYMGMLPKLLSRLGIEHVSLAAHSFGTIYLLNTILLYPHLLHPSKPYVAFFAPWVHPRHTGIRHLQTAELLPGGMINKFSSLAKFVNGTITPLSGMSSGLSSSVVTSLKTFIPQSVAPEVSMPLEPHAGGQRQSDRNRSSPDLNDAVVVQELRKLIPTFLFAETLHGAGQDAQLCLRKPRSVPWHTPARPWEDVDNAVRLLEGLLSQDERTGGQRVWQIHAFHAETDSMVGEKGQVWFDACWMRDQNANLDHQSVFKYDSQIVKGADHDFILDPVFGASEAWLKRVSEAFAVRTVDVMSSEP